MLPPFYILAYTGLIRCSGLSNRRFIQTSALKQRLPLWIGFLTPFLPLAAYYIAPYLLISRHTLPPAWVFAIAPAIYSAGIFLHYVSDAQKYFLLQARRGLIVDGLFARTRNPNYLGEIMIYGAFALLSWHWLPFLVLAGWGSYFIHNMRAKDRSLSRYPGFAAYASRTGMLFPKPIRMEQTRGSNA